MRTHVAKIVTSTWDTTASNRVGYATFTYGKVLLPLCGRGSLIADDPRDADCGSCWRLLNARRTRSTTEERLSE